MSTSNWEDAKARSNYHFNKWHKDTDCVQHLGKFTGGWQTELQSVIEDAKPLNWANRREGTGRENVNVNVEAEENDLKTAGANPKMTIYRGLKDFTKCPTLQRMTDFFALTSTKSKLPCFINSIDVLSIKYFTPKSLKVMSSSVISFVNEKSY